MKGMKADSALLVLFREPHNITIYRRYKLTIGELMAVDLFRALVTQDMKSSLLER